MVASCGQISYPPGGNVLPSMVQERLGMNRTQQESVITHKRASIIRLGGTCKTVIVWVLCGLRKTSNPQNGKVPGGRSDRVE